MFYLCKIIINIFLSIMSFVGVYFIYKTINYSNNNFFLILKLLLLTLAGICFFIFAIKYYGEYKKHSQ